MNSGLAFGLTSSLALCFGIALMQDPVQATATSPLVRAGREFLAVLSPELRSKAVVPLATVTAHDWHYVPRDYEGLPFADLDATATGKAKELLRAGLSAAGMAKVEAIRALEDVLREIEHGSGPRRDPLRYWLRVFGEPGAPRWAFELQGHHVSLHFAIADGRLVAATPCFLGSNPHELKDGVHKGERVLGRAEDLARGLLATLTDAQLQQATITAAAPADVLAGPGHDDAMKTAPAGLSHATMEPLQKELLWRLVREFVEDHEGVFAAEVLTRIDAAGRDRLCFAWAGSTHRGEGHYFRIHGPTVWIEYDNTQNEANHVHALYRDLERDFGGDPLQEHLQKEHGKAPR